MRNTARIGTLLLVCGSAAALAACTSSSNASTGDCVEQGNVSVCQQKGQMAPILLVRDMQPGSTFTWTIGGEANTQTIAENGTLPGTLGVLSATGGPVELIVSGTKADGTAYSDSITVG